MADKKLFSFDLILSHLTDRAKQAVTELKEINSLLSELRRADHTLSKTDLKRIGDNAVDTAGKYGKNVSDYLSAVLDASRMGHKNAEGVAELSLALQSACDINADLAGQYLLAADQAFAMNGSVKELAATLDGACSLADRHAVSMSDLAEGMSAASAQAAASGMDIREATAALAAMLATTDLSGTEAGNALAGLLVHLQQMSGEPMQLLKELSGAYTALGKTDIKYTALFDAVSSNTFQSEALDALLQNYGLYEEMLQDYADGTGTLASEAAKAADTWEGALNRLSNTWTDTIGNLIDSDAVTAIVNTLNGLLSVIEKITDNTNTLGSAGALSGLLMYTKGIGEHIYSSGNRTAPTLLRPHNNAM